MLLTHLKATLGDFYHVGALVPSSPFLAKALTRPIRDQSRGPWRILEVGPGGGPMTKHILKQLKPGDVFDVVEINHTFARRLDETMLAEARRKMPDVTIRMHEAPIEEAPLEGNYDLIVSSLPLNNFPADLVRTILRRFRELLAPGGQLRFFEYAGIRNAKKLVSGRKERQRIGEIASILKEFDRQPGTSREVVWLNMTPAMTRSLRVNGSHDQSRSS